MVFADAGYFTGVIWAGGSYGSDYMSDFFVLDTDPPPTTTVQSPSCLESLTQVCSSFAAIVHKLSSLSKQNLRSYVDSREFSDVTFVVEGRPIYGHRIILCMASER